MAGLPDLLFHDLRRSAARNYTLAGVSKTTIQTIMGHKTSAMFDRYQVAALSDVREAGDKRDAYLQPETDKRPSDKVN